MPIKKAPSESFSAMVSRYGDVFYRILSILISAAILFGVTWLRSEFVSQSRYASDQAQQNALITQINETLIRMENKGYVDAAQTEAIKDHEARMRIMEGRRTVVNASYRIAEEKEK